MAVLRVIDLLERLAVLPQYLLPQLALTRFAGWVATRRWGRLTHWIIRDFISRYGVNMQEAERPQPSDYATFNEFFTRALKPGSRPLADSAFVCPVDGAISQVGPIEGDQIFQAKGHRYSTQALLGGDADLAKTFENGEFATIYLSPRDYHRIHMPCAGRLQRMVHVPGDLFSVNPTTARGVPGLFARNERVVCVFESLVDPRLTFVLVLVGATIVGSMATVWHGVVNPPRPGKIRVWDYGGPQAGAPIVLQKGEEMGRFLLGSTVVMLFPAKTLLFNPEWCAELPVRMGESMGQNGAHAR
jgi:phosphatidylserine decarboxylase